MKTEYLIIGNSVSGVNCIEGIRKVDAEGRITVVSDENAYNYSRPLISCYLGGRMKRKDIAFKSPGFYRENRVELLCGTKAERLDVQGKTLRTDKGAIRFDSLLIATGGKPTVPDIKGCNRGMDGIFTFTKLEDARTLINYLKGRRIKEAVILGGGLIGLKCAEGLIERGIKTGIVELSDRLLPSTLDKKASDIIEENLKRRGCDVFKNDTVARVESRDGKLRGVVLESGAALQTKVLVLAVGVIPNMDITGGTGIKCNRGIIVDSQMRTTAEDIYAAGDVAEGKNLLAKENAVIAIWPVAARQGRIAGINMAGGKAVYKGMFPMNAVDIAGIPVISFGITDNFDAGRCELLRKTGDGFYKKIVLRDNTVIGCIFLGRIERSGIFSGLMRDRVDVSNFKTELLSDDFGLLVLPKEYRKHLVTGEGIEV